ncbi:RHS repeat protein [Chitinasiproducens palmae]|uniref:YD repeat-containing protein n=1 Tax=Chitinasiproducens palmae TaxID=1770053 RepID=A0A1H2PQY5_9BURK|nr:RHS repeat protein [Chitinasiproducens palmae]SDV49172.1 YD repeat-containing protein [Chitinasiproducens palmae]
METVLDSRGFEFDPSSCTQVFGYDANSRITSITATSGSRTWVQTFTRDASGNITAISPWVAQ